MVETRFPSHKPLYHDPVTYDDDGDDDYDDDVDDDVDDDDDGSKIKT